MESGFALFVRFTLRPGHGAAFDQLVAETGEGIRDHEPGTIVYACHEVDGAADQRMFYELYRDREAFDAHEAQPHVARFLAERDQHVAATDVDFLSLTGGKIPGNTGGTSHDEPR